MLPKHDIPIFSLIEQEQRAALKRLGVATGLGIRNPRVAAYVAGSLKDSLTSLQTLRTFATSEIQSREITTLEKQRTISLLSELVVNLANASALLAFRGKGNSDVATSPEELGLVQMENVSDGEFGENSNGLFELVESRTSQSPHAQEQMMHNWDELTSPNFQMVSVLRAEEASNSNMMPQTKFALSYSTLYSGHSSPNHLYEGTDQGGAYAGVVVNNSSLGQHAQQEVPQESFGRRQPSSSMSAPSLNIQSAKNFLSAVLSLSPTELSEEQVTELDLKFWLPPSIFEASPEARGRPPTFPLTSDSPPQPSLHALGGKAELSQSLPQSGTSTSSSGAGTPPNVSTIPSVQSLPYSELLPPALGGVPRKSTRRPSLAMPFEPDLVPNGRFHSVRRDNLVEFKKLVFERLKCVAEPDQHL